MEAALRLLVPKIVGQLSFEVYAHQGKRDLVERLAERLRGYSAWIPASWRIVVVVDRDEDDCEQLKAKLEKIAAQAGFVTRSRSGNGPYVVVNRIAIEELEAWYFGDWEAVRVVYPRVAETIPRRAKYRASDAIAGGTWEAFERLLQSAGYIAGGLPKIEAARSIAEHMEPDRNTSPSFRVLRDALLEFTSAQR
jgi:hypothetical protein